MELDEHYHHHYKRQHREISWEDDEHNHDGYNYQPSFHCNNTDEYDDDDEQQEFYECSKKSRLMANNNNNNNGGIQGDNCIYTNLLSTRSVQDDNLPMAWFPSVWLSEYNPHNGDDSMSSVPNNDRNTPGGCYSLQRQLHQVKNRLWPVAQHLARVSRTSPQKEFRRARQECNPFDALDYLTKSKNNNNNTYDIQDDDEEYEEPLFMNRSALKLANINALLDFTLTRLPSFRCNKSAPKNPFLFCDLCSAPGGFSEYLLHRLMAVDACSNQATGRYNSRQIRGFAMSLVGRNEHGKGTPQLLLPDDDDKNCLFSSPFCRYTFSTGADGTGNVYKWDNILGLERDISHELAALECHESMDLIVCDGGMDAQRDVLYQEQVCTKLVVSQAAAALHLLRRGGTLLLKLFGTQTAPLRLLVHDFASRYFENIICVKPVTSRPASAERYLICTGYGKTTNNVVTDGRAWRDRILLADPETVSSIMDPKLISYLDQFDRQMLDLNLKACFAILSTMERKLHLIMQQQHEEDYNNYGFGHGHDQDWDEYQGFDVDTEAYKRIWQLDDR